MLHVITPRLDLSQRGGKQYVGRGGEFERKLVAPDRDGEDNEQRFRVMPQLGAVRRLRGMHGATELGTVRRTQRRRTRNGPPRSRRRK